MPLTLYEFPLSHNCTKVRAALKRKDIVYGSVDVPPADRSAVRRVSGQGLVPVLRDGDIVVTDSTRILLYLEERYPEPPLLPREPAARAECLVLEDWADHALMALTRRLAYWRFLAMPGALERIWRLPQHGLRGLVARPMARRIARRRFGLSEEQNNADEQEARRAASLAMDRLGGRAFLIGDSPSVADITLAAMAAPLWAAPPSVTGDPAVGRLLDWIPTILAPEDVALYQSGP